MAITGLENYTYPRQIEFFDEERRGRRGAGSATAYDRSNPPEEWGNAWHVIDYRDAYVQQYTLDCTGTSSSDRKKITLFSLANGCKNVMEYYGPSALDTIECTQYWEDKNGHRITQYNDDVFQIVLSEKYEDTYAHKPIWVNPPGVNWHDVGYPGTGEVVTFRTHSSITWLKDNSSPYDPPALSGIVDLDNFDTYYSSHGVSSSNTDVFENWLNVMEHAGDDMPITSKLPSEDTTEPGGGDDDNPDYNPYSDIVGLPSMPTGGSALSSGFIRAYTPTTSQLQAIARKLWSNEFYETILKINNDPMEAIISLHSMPFTMSMGSANCVIGNYDTGIAVNTITSQFYIRDLGELYIPEHWASALDYSPYVTVDIFLPYIGVRSLQVDDIIGKRLNVVYYVDVLTGATVCHIKCDDNVLYTYNADLMMKIPITMSSMEPLLNSLKSSAGNIVSGASQGGIGGALGASIGSAINVATSKHSQVSRGSSLTGSFGCLSIFTPYLIIHRPIQSLASGFAHFKGYPSNITTTLGNVNGYTEVESIHLNGITCTDNEKAEIEALLYNGVIF